MSYPHDWEVIMAQATKIAPECVSLSELARKLDKARSTLRDALARMNDGQGMTFEEFKAQAATSPDMFQGVPATKVVRFLRKAPRTRKEISALLDRSEDTVDDVLASMIAAGYSIERHLERFVVPPRPVLETDMPDLFPSHADGSPPTYMDITFGVLSDTHCGSKAEQPTALHDFCHIAYEEYGVRHFLHGGDVMAGFGVYKGQMMDVYATTGAEQARIAMNNIPYFADARWYMLGGNHGFSFYKAAGLDARREMLRDHPQHGLNARGDITLLPFDAADLPLLPGIDAHLWHPAGGIPYAYSYRGQRAADQLAFDELMEVTVGAKPKPTLRLLVIGHMHVMYTFFAGPIFVVGAGCFEGRTSYLLRKGLIPHIGGWIIKCRFVDGFLHRVSPTAIRYREIDGDWQHWNARRLAKGREIVEYEPLFKWTGTPLVTGAMMQKEAT